MPPAVKVVQPTYLVIDVSYSMEPVMEAMNDMLVEFIYGVAQNPRAADATRVCIISFSNDAITELPLISVQQAINIPELKARGGTSFYAALSTLKDSITADLATLRAEGVRVFRPVVFFVTDGEPTDSGDSWRAVLRDLQAESFRARPVIIAIGMGASDPDSIREVASSPDTAFISSRDASAIQVIGSIGELLLSFNGTLTSSILASQATVEFPIPESLLPVPRSLER